ncbi:hypothetical protein FS837_007006 [Tulasnella sp. UAMH 9824]|nr:hypothetical protein FS837_007006 [Tulasnella sp. UAMH 9824]
MIATGNLTDVPFNRLIPEAISGQKPSDPVMPARRKPWETVDTNRMANEVAARMPDEIANSLAAEIIDKDNDRTADEMADKVAEIAHRMAGELPERMADEAEMAGKAAQ